MKYTSCTKSYSACVYKLNVSPVPIPKTPKFVTGTLLIFILPGRAGAQTPTPGESYNGAVFGEDFGHKRSKSSCFQDQPGYMLTSFMFPCINLEECCIHFLKGVGNFLEVFNLNRLNPQNTTSLLSQPEALTTPFFNINK